MKDAGICPNNGFGGFSCDGVTDTSSESSIDSTGGLALSGPSPSRLLKDGPNEKGPDGFAEAGSLSVADFSSR